MQDTNLAAYTVAVAPVGSDAFVEVARGGSTAIVNGKLASFDPATLGNDAYVLRVTAEDLGGKTSSMERIVNVSGDLKLGNFRLSFTDMALEVVGLPVSVSRTYDSLTSSTRDDLGYGWRLEFRDTDLRTSVGVDETYRQLGIRTAAFRDNSRVYLTLPGGKREGFTFKPTRDRLSGYFPPVEGYDTAIYHPAFVADKGVTSTLSVRDTRLSHVENRYFGLGSGVPYNPADSYFGGSYTLTTKEGVVYEIEGDTGDLLSVSNPNGNMLTFTEAGITSDTGQAVVFGRDAVGRIVSATDPMGQKVLYAYDDKGDLVSVTDRENNKTQFKYALATRPHFLTEIIDPLGRTGIKNEYDDKGRLVNMADALGKSVQIAYDPDNSKETVTDALGNPTTYVYDRRDNVVTEVDALGGVTQRTYDEDNNLLSQTDPLGRTTAYTYDFRGNLTSSTDPLGNTTRYTLNNFGEVLTKTNPLGEVTTYTYDKNGNRLSLTNAEGNTTGYDYDIKGRPVAISAPDGSTTRFVYDASNRVTSQTDAMGRTTTYTYDANGNQLTETHTERLPDGTIRKLVKEWTYDSNNRVTSTKDELGNVTSQEYDKVGNQIASTDPLGHRTEYEYDDKGQQTKVTYADRTSETTVYDAKGQTIAQTNRPLAD